MTEIETPGAKLIQHVQREGFSWLTDDAEALKELARRAINQALITPIPIPGASYYDQIKERPAPVVAAVQEIAEQVTKEVVAGEVARLKSDPEFLQKLQAAIIAHFPVAILAAVRTTMEEVVEASCRKSIAEINQQIQQGSRGT